MININHISEVKGCDVTTVISEFVYTCLQHVQLIRVGSNYYNPEPTVNIHIIIIKHYRIIK